MYLTETLLHFDRERSPERVVNVKGGGAHVHFEVKAYVAKNKKAKFLSKVEKKTDLFLQFSTIRGGKGSTDTASYLRGFVIKFSPFHLLDCIYKSMAILDAIG